MQTTNLLFELENNQCRLIVTIDDMRVHKFFSLLLIFLISFLSIFARYFSVGAYTPADPPISYTLFSSTSTYVYQMAIDSSGNVYAAITGPDKIFKYSSSGALITSFGTSGSGPTGVAITPGGNVIVANYQQDKVETWSSSGSFVSTFGSSGSGNNQFSSPYGIATDSSGNIYVADAGNNRVQKFNSSMVYQSTITGNGGAFNFPQSVSIDGSDNLYVLDSGNNRVQVFNSGGTFVRTITGNGGAWNYPEGMAVESDGTLYVADSGNDRIQVFNSSGVYQQQFGTSGASLGQLQYVAGLAVTSSGILYIGDQDRIQKATFDRAVASVAINSFSGNETTDTTPVVTGTATDALTALTSIQFSIDGGTYQNCTADDGSVNELSETFSCAIPLQAGGQHTVSVKSTDTYTNTNSGSGISSYTFNIFVPFQLSGPPPPPSSQSVSIQTPTPTPFNALPVIVRATLAPSPTPSFKPTSSPDVITNSLFNTSKTNVNTVIENTDYTGAISKVLEVFKDEKVVISVATGGLTGYTVAAATVVAVQATTSLAFVYTNSTRSVAKFPFDFSFILIGWTKQIFNLIPFFRKKSTGAIFDAVSGKPVNGALILFFSNSGNLKTTFSDPDGHYEAELKPDQYKLKVEKTSYVFPSNLVKSRSFKFFQNIYVHPEMIPVADGQHAVNSVSVPLDPVKVASYGFLRLIYKLTFMVGATYLIFSLLVK